MTTTRLSILVLALTLCALLIPASAGAAQPTCHNLTVTIIARTGVTTYGTDGPDVILGTPDKDTIYAGKGADVVCAGSGGDVVYGGPGDDQLDGEGGPDRLFGEEGETDRLWGGDDNNRLDGGPGAHDRCAAFWGRNNRFVGCESVYR